MALPQLKDGASYTYADLLEWDEDVRAELHDGKAVLMPPTTTKHQEIVGNLLYQLHAYIKSEKKEKECKLYLGPFGVRLFPKNDRSDNTVFEPDIVLICNLSKLDARGCNGAPDLVIEVASPSTAKYDRVYKFRKYLKAEAREYWIVDPETKSVQVCILDNDRYIMSVYDETGKAPVSVLEGCEVDLKRSLRGRGLLTDSFDYFTIKK